MKRIWIAAVLVGLAVAPAHAQGFLMNSAETIDKGNFKLAAFPILIFGKDGADSEFGFGGRAGYGFTPRFDVEVVASAFDGAKLYGADAELWLVKGGDLDVSLTGGIHKTDFDGDAGLTGIDAVATVSGHATSKFEPYVGLKFSFESASNDGGNFTLIHAVPGFEYALSRNVDIVGELGVALNDDSTSYASVGLAFYLR